MAKESVIIGYKVDNDGALKKMRDMRGELDKTPESTQRASGGVTSFTKVLAGAAAAFYAVQGAARFMGGAIRESAAQETILTQLGVAVSNVGVAFNDVSGDLQGMFAKLQETTRFGDTDTAQVLTRLLNTTGDYGAAVSLLTSTLDTSVAMGKDANSVAEALGRAVQGNIGALSRYGITLDDATKKMLAQADATGRAEILQGLLNEKFGGAAQADLDTYAGRIVQVGNYWGDFKEVIGDVWTSLLAGEGVFEFVIDGLKWMAGYAKNVGEVMVFVANVDYAALWRAALHAAAREFLQLNVTVDEAALAIVTTLSLIPGVASQAFSSAASFIAKDLQAAQIGVDALAGSVKYNLAKGLESANDAANNFRDKVNGLKLDGVTREMTKLGGAAEDTAEEVEDLTDKFVAMPNIIFGSLGLVEAMEEGADKFSLFGEEVNTVQAAIANAVAQSGALNSFTDWLNGVKTEAPEAGKAVRDLGKTVEDTGFTLENTFSDLLGKGFVGELNSFSDIWKSVWGDLAKYMVGTLGDAFTEAFSSDGSYNPTLLGGIQNFWDGISGEGKSGGEKFGQAVAGLVTMYEAYQSGSVAQGALGGLMAGASTGQIWLAAAGAVVGGIAGWLGGDKTPTTNATVNTLTGQAATLAVDNQSLDDDAIMIWRRQRLAEWNEAKQNMLSLLRVFQDPALFKLIENGSVWDFGGAGDVNSWAQIWREKILPDALKEVFQTAVNQGLGDLGVSEDTMNRLWQELAVYGDDLFIDKLGLYVGALVNAGKTMDSLDWDTMMDEANMSSMDAYRAFMTDTFSAINMLSAGWDQMDLLTQAQTVQDITDLAAQARQTELEMLRQINQLQDQINRSIDQQIEGIRAGGLEGADKENFYIDLVNATMADIADGVGSAEELAQLMSDLQRYTGLLQGVMGDRFYSEGYDQYTIDALTWARDISDEYFAQFRDEISADAEALYNEVAAIYQLLTNWDAGWIDGGGGPPVVGGGGWVWINGGWVWTGEGEPTTLPPDNPPGGGPGGGGSGGPFTNDPLNVNVVSDVNVNSVVTVVPSELFATYVQSVVNSEINRRNQLEKGIN